MLLQSCLIYNQFTSSTSLNEFSFQLPPLSADIDEIHIVNVQVTTGTIVSQAYLIWTDLVNDIIGSFTVRNLVMNTCPNTRIKLKGRPINGINRARFIIFQAAANGTYTSTNLTDQTSLALTLEFHSSKK
jgi:hypothetical protein